jgi:hypothetical protein
VPYRRRLDSALKPDAFIHRYGAHPIQSLPRFWRVAVTCRRCGRHNQVPVAYLVLVGKVDPTHSLAEFAHGLRCSICNSPRVVVAIEGHAIEPRQPVAPARRIGSPRRG